MYGGVDFTATLECSKCEAEYVLVHRARHGLWYESKADIKAHQERLDRRKHLNDALASEKIRPLADRLEKLARGHGHQTQHWFSALAPILGLRDLGQFRAEVRSAGGFVGWVHQYVRPSNALSVSASLGMVDPDLKRRIGEVDEADAAIGTVKRIPVGSRHSG
jgi:hypothetical protein